jgi:ectoine hydroxylase
MAKTLNDVDVRNYHRDGYVLLKGLLDSDEVGALARAAREDRVLDEHSFGRADGEGWNHPTDTIYGMIARCESIVNSAEKILEGEVYHITRK